MRNVTVLIALSGIGKIRSVAAPIRVTGPLLDVLETFLRAWQNNEDLHGWTIMKRVRRSGPTVYGVLDRLEDAGWIDGHWEDEHPSLAGRVDVSIGSLRRAGWLLGSW
jgi:Transcriptional regulator PadR-like family